MTKIKIDQTVKVLGKTIEYIAYKDPLYMDRLAIKLSNNKSYLRLFRRNLTDNFYNMLKQTVDPKHHHEQNIIICVFGQTGSGKSSVAMAICKNTTPDRFSYRNMCFFDMQVIKMASEVPRDSFIVRDEGVDKAVYGVGAIRTSRQLQVLTETCRKFGLNLVFIEPEFRVNELAKYYIETWDMDMDNRITRCALIEATSKQCIGALYIPVLDENDDDWLVYNKIKDKFIEDIKAGKLTEGKEDYREIAKKMYSMIDFELYDTKGKRKTLIRAEYPSLTIGETQMIADFVEVMLKNGGQIE